MSPPSVQPSSVSTHWSSRKTHNKTLTVFDLAPYKQGLLPPKDFLKLCSRIRTPNYLGHFNWTRQFVQDVYDGKVEGISFEGVVGKAKNGRHDITMSKAKTKAWLDRVKEKFSPEEAARIAAS